MELLENLNEQQRAAVTATEGYVRLTAGAGSGKTRTLAHRYAYISEYLGVSPAHILCVTFTNKAAAEMRKRIRKLTGDNGAGMVCTFHGFCHRVLKEDIHVLGFPTTFLVMDTEDQKLTARSVMEQLGLKLQDKRVKHILDDIISPRKGDSLSYIGLVSNTDGSALEQCALNASTEEDAIFYRYLYEQKKSFALDYDDLIYYVLYIFQLRPDILKKWQDRLEYIMVDEFQDVDDSEYSLVMKLAGKHRNLFIVGDPDQTIYSWRGSKVDYIINFDKQFPSCTSLMLTTNYRSTPEIVAATNSLIEKNGFRLKKTLTAQRPGGAEVIYNHARCDEDEMRWIADRIEQHIERGESPSSIAVLYRAHHMTRLLEEELIKRSIPHRIYGNVAFYERAEVKDALCYLRMVSVGDDIAFRRVVNLPRRGFGKTRVEQLAQYAADRGLTLYEALKQLVEIGDPLVARTTLASFVSLIEGVRARAGELSICDAMEELMAGSGYESMLRENGDQDRLDNLAELRQAIIAFERDEGEVVTISDYLARVSMLSDADTPDNVDAVRMMTVHCAKGLEFPTVFVFGLSEGIFPGRRTNTRDKMEEERRLAYVAMTRAENVLYLSDSEGLAQSGSIKYPSRFIFDIDRSLIHYETELSSDLVDEARRHIETSDRKLDMQLLDVGDELAHPVFGKGRVLALDDGNNCYKVRFESGAERSISYLAPFLKKNGSSL